MKNLLSAGFCLLLGLSLLAGCGGGGAIQTGVGPPPPITVAIQESASSLEIGQSDSLTATVSNDPHKGGVKWTVTCASANCGTMASAASASGAADIYNAPSTSETVTVTATSVSDPRKGATTQVTVNPTLVIASGSPPNGTVGTSYGSGFQCGPGRIHTGFALGAGGGAPPYTLSWAPASGSSLPSGLSIGPSHCNIQGLDWEIAGDPTVAGTYNVIITVTDSESPPQHASANYSITVNP